MIGETCCCPYCVCEEFVVLGVHGHGSHGPMPLIPDNADVLDGLAELDVGGRGLGLSDDGDWSPKWC